MAARRGYVKLHRELIDHPIFAHDGLFRLWLYCLLRANWKDAEWLMPGTLTAIQIKRGQFITGGDVLHSELYGTSYKGEWKPSQRTVWRWLKALADLGCLDVATVSHRCSIVTVCKYDTYQSVEDDACHADVTPVTNRCHADVTPVTTNKEKQEPKKVKKVIQAQDVTIPIALETPEAKAALAEWLEYKQARGEGYKKASFVNHLLAEYATVGPLAFVQAVSYTIGRNYAGLVEPNRGGNQRPRSGPGQNHDPDASKKDPNHGRM